MGDLERTYLSGREYQALLSLFAQVSHFEVVLPLLERRAKAAGVWEKLKEAEALTDDALREIPRTIPEHKLRHIMADLKNAKIYVRIEPPGCVPTIDMTWASYVPAKALNLCLGYVAEHECMLCDKTPVEARRCEYRQMLDDCLAHEIATQDAAHCRYSDMTIGLEDAI